MSERKPGIGSFVLGVALGIALGLMFAPEGGEAFRGKLVRRVRGLRALAAGDDVEQPLREEDSSIE